MAIKKTVYPHSADYARDNGELPAYRESNNINRECAAAIDKAIHDSHSRERQYHYDLPAAVEKVTAVYGEKRVAWVMAAMVQRHDYDGRYSDQNKKWAQGFNIPREQEYGDSKPRVPYYGSNAHPVLIDGFIKDLRKHMEQKKEHIIYPHDYETAYMKGEADAYHKSMKQNFACIKAIDKVLYDSESKPYPKDLTPELQKLTDKYGAERMAYVLAAVVQESGYDNGFSGANRHWAKGFNIPEKHPIKSYAHSTLVNEGITQLRDLMKEQGLEKKPSITGQLKENAARIAAEKPAVNKTAVKNKTGQEL